MSDCCSSSNSCGETSRVAKKRACPRCTKNGTLLPTSTIYHHLKQSWLWQTQGGNYYFCESFDCEVVYFNDENSKLIKQSKLRTSVGVKTQKPNDLICYCYGVDLQAARENSNIKSFVMEMTKHGSCACETRNPSGRCCLKDFPK